MSNLPDLDLENSPSIKSAREFLSESDPEDEVNVTTVNSDGDTDDDDRSRASENEIEFEVDDDPNRTLFVSDEETTDDDAPIPGLQDRVIIDSSEDESVASTARSSITYSSPFNIRRRSSGRRDTLAELRAQARAQVDDLATHVFHRERRVSFSDGEPDPAPAPAPAPSPASTSTSTTSTSTSTGTPTSAPPTSTSGSQGGNGPNPPDICQICKQPGHVAPDCPRLKSHTSKPPSRRAAKHQARQSRRASAIPGSRKSTGLAVVGGMTLATRSTPADPDSVQSTKTWNKKDRSRYDAEEKAAFKKSATGYALSKSNKLTLIEVNPKSDDALKTIRNVKVQMNLLKQHVRDHDMHDVLENIVVPLDIRRSHKTSPVTFNLFDDHRRLDASMVAASNAWYNLWIDHRQEPHIRENLTYTFTFFQNNTSESLWNLCLEDYDEYHSVSKGGPLMFFLILKRLQNSSEQAMENLREQVKNLKIRDLPGENVDDACSLIKAAHAALEAASSEDRNYVPDDFLRTVLSALQTTSVGEFNKIFKKIEDEVTHASDRTGLKPDWPELKEVIMTAKNAYTRISASKTGWCVSKSQGKRGLNASTPSGLEPDCWNCNGKHKVQDCTKPRNEQRIAENRRKMMAKIREARKQRAERKAAHKASSGSSGKRDKANRRRKTTDDGVPMILNVKNQWVPDQGKIREDKKSALKAEFKDTLKEIYSSTSTSSVDDAAAPAPAPAPSTSTSAASAQFAKIDAALEKLFG